MGIGLNVFVGNATELVGVLGVVIIDVLVFLVVVPLGNVIGGGENGELGTSVVELDVVGIGRYVGLISSHL